MKPRSPKLPKNLNHLTIIGAGNMGGALVRGLQQSNWGQSLNLSVVDTHPNKTTAFASDTKTTCYQSWDQVPDWGQVIVLCVKPQDLPTVSQALGAVNAWQGCQLVISVLAGMTTSDLAVELKFSGPIIRAMPNIAATVDCAATAFCGNQHVTTQLQGFACDLFSCCGEAYWVKESMMDAVTGLSGSGPAYIYMVIEALTDGGVNMGLPRDLARNLATQTVLGAATMVKRTQEHPAVLKEQVTTPAGTTISACVELESHGLRSMFVAAVKAATERSAKLGRK